MNSPIPAPTANETSRARIQFNPLRLVSRMKIAMPRPPVTPADRSISASRITNVNATASIISAAVWVIRFAMLVLVKKKGVAAQNTQAEHHQPGEGRQHPHLATADPQDVVVDLVTERALVAGGDRVRG